MGTKCCLLSKSSLNIIAKVLRYCKKNFPLFSRVVFDGKISDIPAVHTRGFGVNLFRSRWSLADRFLSRSKVWTMAFSFALVACEMVFSSSSDVCAGGFLPPDSRRPLLRARSPGGLTLTALSGLLPLGFEVLAVRLRGLRGLFLSVRGIAESARRRLLPISRQRRASGRRRWLRRV